LAQVWLKDSTLQFPLLYDFTELPMIALYLTVVFLVFPSMNGESCPHPADVETLGAFLLQLPAKRPIIHGHSRIEKKDGSFSPTTDEANVQQVLPKNRGRRERGFMGPIDFVYCWAGEEVQLHHSNITSSKNAQHIEGVGFNEIQLSLRSLQLFAPWFNNVYVLVNGPAKLPSWVTDRSRIHMIDRCSLFPNKNDCPTKNTAACQAVLHLVQGLKEHFVYMEDDFFFVSPMEPSDFFADDGKPEIGQYEREVETMYTLDEKQIRFQLQTGMPDMGGPDRPPSKVPLVTRYQGKGYMHNPVPMLKSFSAALESEFAEWFAFVRSHRTRFCCCDASYYGNCNDEDFSIMYPAMLHERHMSQRSRTADGSPMVGTCYMGDELPLEFDSFSGMPFRGEECIQAHLRRPGQKFLNVQNIRSLLEWHGVTQLLEQHFQKVLAVSRFPPTKN